MRRRAFSGTVATVVAAAVLLLASACAGPAAPIAPAVTPTPTVTSTPSPSPKPDPFPREPLTDTTRYVALGDSFASGMGGGGEQGRCRTSNAGYPSVFTRESGVDLIVNAACAGATTSELISRQLIALDDRTELVTVSIGGNDLGVASIAADCAARRAIACRNELTAALSMLNVLPERLTAAYRAIAEAAPNARIVVTGYNMLYDASNPSAKDFGTAAAINAATLGLNDTIKQAVDAERARGVAMTYVGVDFSGHALGDRTPWINTSGPYAFHPTAAGYRQYAARLIKLLGTAR